MDNFEPRDDEAGENDSGWNYRDSNEGMLRAETDFVETVYESVAGQTGSKAIRPQIKEEAVVSQDWTDVNHMKKMWEEDTGRSMCQKSSDSRELSRIVTDLDTWYRLNMTRADIWDHFMVNVTSDGGAKMRILSEGSGQTSVAPGMYFMMQYTAFVEPNFKEPVDATFYRGRREVYKYDVEEPFVYGLFLAIGRMRLGDRAHVRLTPDYGFGQQGVPPRIPGNAVLHYIVELREEEWSDEKASLRFIREPEDAKKNLGFDVCFKAASEFREKGRKAFAKRAYESARDNFEYGMEATSVCLSLLCEPSDAVKDLTQSVRFLDIALKRNATVVHAKLDNWDRVGEICLEIVEVDPLDCKGMYYLAMSYFRNGKVEDAFEWIQKGIRRYPNSPEFAEMYQKIRKFHDKNLDNEKVMCERMFGSTLKPVDPKAEIPFTIAKEVREHVAQEIEKMTKNVKLEETPLNYALFQDKHNLKYVETEAQKAGLTVVVRNGLRRTIVKLMRTHPLAAASN